FSGITASGSIGGYGHGGAIYGWSSTITLSDNGSVTFSGNTTSYRGGAIDGSTITLSNNGSVTFSGNTTSGSNGGYGYGGAIDGSTITLSDNGSVTFSGNTASGSNGGNGGAIDSSTITLSDNGSVTFSGNTASSYGGAIHVLGEDDGLYITGNALGTNEDGSLQQVLFENNGVKGEDAHGGAIMAGVGAALVINNNGEVVFKGNYAQDDSYFSAHTSGGAICKQYGIFSIQNNASVIFEGNYTLNKDGVRLQSIYAYDKSGLDGKMVVNFSAPEGGKIEFRDSIDITVYWSSSSALRINAQYENEPGTLIAQTGDVIFTGAYATRETLTDILEKHDRWIVTDAEIENSKHSTFCGVAQLYDGRLIIRDGAVIDAYGINVNASASGESTPTLMLHHGTLTSYADQQYATNAVTIAGGASLSLAGQNEMRFSSLTLSGGSSLIVNVDNTHTTSAALTLNSSTLTISGELTLKLNAAAGITDGQTFALLTGVSQPTNWTSTNITVTSGTAGWDVSFDDLSWVGDTLWLYYDSRPDLEIATWTNESKDGKWNTTSLNWEQNEVDYEYKDGVAVVFGDTGADTVTLVGNIAPKSVLVDSAEDYTWEADPTEGGKLTGSMKLTKKESGTLTINTSNDYTGGTEIKGGTVLAGTATALGTGAVVLNGGTLEIGAAGMANVISNIGNSALQTSSGVIHELTGIISNSGTLALSGSFDASALAKSDSDDIYVDVNGTEDKNGSGFLRSGDFNVLVVNGGTVDATAATITWDGAELEMTGGTGFAAGAVDYGTYRILSDHTADALAIHQFHAASANAKVTLAEGGTLTANDANGVEVTANGGTINLTAGALSGTWSNATVNATGGSLAGRFAGASTLAGTSFNLGSTAVQNDGTLTLSGSFNASGMASSLTNVNMRVDEDGIVSQNGSGFLRSGDFTVLVAGGTVDSTNATVTYGGQTLSMTGGTGFGVGMVQYDTYLLKGSDTATVSKITTMAGESLQKIDMQGGTLNVNASTDKLVASAGNIQLSAGTLGGSIGGTTAVAVNGTATISGNNSYTGGTTLSNGNLTITHVNALGAGSISAEGSSSLTVGNGVMLVLDEVISNTGELTLSGSIDASALQLNKTEAGRLSLSGERVGLTESGFSQGVEYTVLIVDGGSTVNAGAGISHKDYLSRTQLVLGEDGVARAGAEVDYTHFFLTGGDSAEVSKIAEVSTRNQVELNGVTMDSGLLTVDQSITVSATGGSLVVTDTATLGGAIDNATVSTAAGDYTAEIAAALKGTTSLEIAGGTITVSGDNSYTGGTVVNEGTLMAGHNNALGSGDVTVNGAALALNDCTIANKVFMNGTSTLSHANGASYIMLGRGSNVSFRDGYALNSGRTLAVAAGGATYTGALTLGGGTLALSGQLTVSGDVVFEAGTKTTLDVSGWASANDGTILADFGAANRGYADDSLTLSGLAGDWELDFDTATGILTLVAVQAEVKPEPTPKPEFAPELNRNQQIVFDTVKDIVAEGKPEGELGKLAEQITATRNEEELRSLLDAVSGSEYATLMSSQIDSNLGHMRNLRSKMGQGWQLVGNNYMRAMIEMFGQQSELDADENGRGYKRSETGGQFTLEFIGCTHMSSGVAVAASRTKLTPDNALEQTIDNAYVDFYTSYRSNGDQNTGYSAKFSLGVGMHDYKLKRNVLGMQAKTTTKGFSVNFMHESAYAMSLTEESSLQVFGVLESSFGRIDGFRENGLGTAALMMDKQNAWTTDMTLGLRYIQMFESLATPKATLTLQGGITATAGDTTVDTKLHFAGAQQHAYTQHGVKRGRLGYNLGFNLHLPMDDTSAVYCHGETILRSGSTEWNANIGYQVAF
ncbi:MAG: autotransporter-associated beta strand repeat-containing protein, partial [Akkermansia sp.]|nr:autotransporter-associated beta strand repeat-containing protein [Akkermansia sp.]